MCKICFGDWYKCSRRGGGINGGCETRDEKAMEGAASG